MADKKLYVVKSASGRYYNGMKQWEGHLRHAKVYVDLKHANNIVKEWARYEPYIVEIKMFEVNGNG